VQIAGIDVVDAPLVSVVGALRHNPSQPVLAFALHVGGLNAATDTAVRDAYGCADLTYADGVAVVLLARLAGAAYIDRSPTTDLGPVLFDSLAAGSNCRVFLIGGPPGLAEAAGRRLATDHAITVVGTMGGYDVDPDAFLGALHATRPDVVLVGLGSPREMFFLRDLRAELPTGLYLTCGGWFGFLAGTEKRAPAALRKSGLEWLWRLKQAPRRLVGRYTRGIWTTLALACGLLVQGLWATENTVPDDDPFGAESSAGGG
jgi:N-acetylglucosaminyldiphosphoundecaprenol N-acetyl-beta-D-mannosaminyltransferase